MKRLKNWLMKIGDVQRQSFLHFGTSLFVTAAGFLTTMAITHLLETPDVPGGYFLFLSYLGIFTLISNGGLGGAAVTLMSGERKNVYFSAYFMLRGLFLIASLILLIILLPAMRDLTSAGMWIWLATAVILTTPADIAGTWLTASGRAGHVQAGQFISAGIRIIVQLIAIFAGYGAGGLAGGMVAGILVTAIITLRQSSFTILRFGWAEIEDLIRLSFWSFLAAGGMVIYGNLDAILLGYFAGDTEVGLYRIALQFASFALFSTMALATILYPKIVSWRTDSRKEWISPTLSRAVSYSLLLAVPVCAGGIVIGDSLLYFLYGSPYAMAYYPLILLLFAQVAYVFVFLWNMALSALQDMKTAALAALLAGIANILFNIAFIPVYGISGASLAILLTVLIHAIAANKGLKQHIMITWDFRALKNILLSAGVMAGFILLIRVFLPISHAFIAGILVLCGAALYFLILVRLEKGIESGIKQVVRDSGFVLPDWI